MSNLEFTALKVLQQRKSLLHQHKCNREAVKEFDNCLYILYMRRVVLNIKYIFSRNISLQFNTYY